MLATDPRADFAITSLLRSENVEKNKEILEGDVLQFTMPNKKQENKNGE